MSKHKPATALPWNVIGNGYTIWAENEIIFSANSPRARGTKASKDAAYIAHACNAYPELVEALRFALADAALLNVKAKSPGVSERFDRGLALLAKLGEA